LKRTNNLKLVLLATAAFLIVLQVEACFVGIRKAIQGGADFRQLYTAGYMLRSGHRHQLYDYDCEHKYQNDVVSPQNSVLPFDHLAYEALLFLPLSYLKYRAAYFVFFAANLALLAVSFRLLLPYLVRVRQVWRWLPNAIILCFFPVALTLIQGQDSIVLLTLLLAAAASVDRGHEEIAGGFVGLTLFKFQFGVPVAFMFLLWRRWRLLAGIAIVGTAVGVLSLFLVGFPASIAYAHSLLAISFRLSQVTDELKYGTYPGNMPNLRGLTYILAGPYLSQFFTAAGSGLAVLWVAFRKPSFPLAIATALLVSYHALMHDTVLLIVPAGLALEAALASYSWKSTWTIVLVSVLFVLPTLLLMTGGQYYLLALPILALLVLADKPQLLQPHRISIQAQNAS
jgi:hypothetical protein